MALWIVMRGLEILPAKILMRILFCSFQVTSRARRISGALGQFTKSSAIDLAQYKIRVNAVCAGTIRTPLAEKAIQNAANQSFGGDVERTWEVDSKNHILERIGTPDEVANIVNFLLSDESSFMTGGLYPGRAADRINRFS